jgi:hypothetical protein
MIRENELFSISVLDGGGVTLTEEAFPYLAPSTGYQDSIQISLDTSRENVKEGAAYFYLDAAKTYGCMRWEFQRSIRESRHASYSAIIWINTSHGRDLEKGVNLVFPQIKRP